MSSVAGLERTMLSRLQRSEVVTADGGVMSWANPDHLGYPYPEIAGYLLSLLSIEGRPTVELRNRIAERLLHDLSPSGGVGRDGSDYVFDSAMVLRGLIAHVTADGRLPDQTMLQRLHSFIASSLEARHGVEPVPQGDLRHWSLSYGCHLLKTVLAIWAYHDLNPSLRAYALTDQLLTDLLPLHSDGRFRVNAASDSTYMHAHCYAVEGLLVLDGRDVADVRDVIERSADWLAAVQRPDGGMPAGYEPAGPTGVAHSDATSQAVRIWTCVDPGRYREAIARGVEFLTEMVHRDGVRYRPGSGDINTWATIFAIQALRWARTGGDWRWII